MTCAACGLRRMRGFPRGWGGSCDELVVRGVLDAPSGAAGAVLLFAEMKRAIDMDGDHSAVRSLAVAAHRCADGDPDTDLVIKVVKAFGPTMSDIQKYRFTSAPEVMSLYLRIRKHVKE